MLNTTIGSGQWWLYVMIIAALFAAGFGVIYAILKSSEKPAPTMLVVALSMLTLATIIGFLLTQEADLLTLSGVGLGALAGAVNSIFNSIPVTVPEKKPELPEDSLPEIETTNTDTSERYDEGS